MTMSHLHHRSKLGALRLIRQEWDAFGAIAATIVFWIAVGLSSRPLESSAGLILAAISLGAALGGAAFVAGRWVSDRLSRDEYGELILAIDPYESRVQRPYQMVAYAGLGTSGLGILVVVTLGEFPRAVSVFLYGLLLGLSCYCVLGTITLIGITKRHQRRAAILRATKESEARERRTARLKRGQTPNGSGVDS
jgi:uncharacterized membrane protein